jgi:hypothetical protein
MSDEVARAESRAEAFKRANARLEFASADVKARRMKVDEAAKAQRSQFEGEKSGVFNEVAEVKPRAQDF